jgi:EAL domain-containing protein (putative c-di-GMP-specific phosphodiesterase class I)
MLVQPVVALATGAVSGYEALARFARLPGASPQDWFAAAHRAGLGARLEARAVAAALVLGERRPKGTTLSLNVSPNVAGTPEFQAVLPRDLTGLQFEVTEDQLAGDAAEVLAALDGLRRRGGRIAVDDVGAGYAGFRRLMAIAPEVVKLDRALVSGAAAGPRKRALIEAIVHFADRTGAQVCAEGLETEEDLAMVADLGVTYGQGWILGRPAADFTAPPSATHPLGSATRNVDLLHDATQPRGPATHNDGSVDGATRPHGPAAHNVDLVDVLEALAAAESLASVRRTLAGAAPAMGCAEVRLVLHEPDPDEPDPEAPGARAFPLSGAGRPVGTLVCVGGRGWPPAAVRAARTVAAVTGPTIAALPPAIR